MKTANKQIKVASILYLLSGLLFVPFIPVLGAILLIPGIILLANSFLSLEELKKNKVSLIILAIISFIINIPAAIFIVLSLEEISTVQLETSNAPPTTESKRIDLLLKLGLVMILISGVLFATTTWEIISNLVKVIALVGMGAAFLGLSKFSETRLKIESTTKAYFILGLAFFLLTWVGIGYFEVISPWFSYFGDGKNLVYFITLILLGTFLYLINYKFKEKEYLYMGHMCIYLSLYHILAAVGLDLLQVTIILSLLSLIINIIPNNKLISTVKELNYPISYLFGAIILTQCFEADKYIVLIACILNIANVVLLALTKKSAVNEVFASIISYTLLTIGTLKLDISFDNAILLFSVVSIFSLLIKYQKVNQSNWLVSSSQIIYHLLATVLVVIITSYSEPKSVIISTIYLALNIINSFDLYKNHEQIDFRYQPMVILIFFFSLQAFVNEQLFFIGDLLPFSLAAFTYALIYHFTNKQHPKRYYFLILLITLGITFLLNLIFGEIIVALTTLLLVIYLYFTRKKEDIGKRVLLYIAILVNIYVTSLLLIDYGLSSIVANIICLIIFVILTLFIKDKKLKTINYISIVAPLYTLVNTLDMAENLKIVITNIFWLYLLFLFVKFLIKEKEAKDLISTIGLALITLPIIFEADILVGIYIGILAIVIIFIAFNEEHFKKLFYCGVIITIVNIVVQLWEFWTQIPFYLYLLLVGIAIIAFVTYKELHKKEQPTPKKVAKSEPVEQKVTIQQQPVVQNAVKTEVKKPVEPQQEEIEQLEEPPKAKEQAPSPEKYVPKVVRFCPACGTQNNGGKFCRNCGRNLQI